MIMTSKKLEKIRELRRTLHDVPELSMREVQTQQMLKAFLHFNTSCEIHAEDGWFYAVRRVGRDKPTIAFRADMDAIPNAAAGRPFHGCGHDGHAASVAGLAYLTEEMSLDKNLVFLFQPGEETGEGAVRCAAVIEREQIAQIYGYHSIPGYPVGEVLWCRDVFACASQGIILHFVGQQCHAAYPETGCNPAVLMSGLVGRIDAFLHQPYRGMVLCTVVGMQLGGRNFGVSAGEGELCLTVRAHYQEDLEALTGHILTYAETEGSRQGIAVTHTAVDVFPDTVCDRACAETFRSMLEKNGIPYRELAEPMRWSEDFGWYCKRTRGVYFGIGAGEESPALHTDQFCYNDAILPEVLNVFLKIIES